MGVVDPQFKLSGSPSLRRKASARRSAPAFQEAAESKPLCQFTETTEREGRKGGEQTKSSRVFSSLLVKSNISNNLLLLLLLFCHCFIITHQLNNMCLCGQAAL